MADHPTPTLTLLALALLALAAPSTARMAEAPHVTTNWGAPVDNARDSQTVGQHGPTLLQDTVLLERLQTQNRERIPERVVHARGAMAKGVFTVTNNLSDISTAHVFAQNGRTTDMAVRFSTVTHGRDSPEFIRDPRGFALKFYTEEGNLDIVGNTWPVFFIRDGVRFPSFVRAMKPSPITNLVEWWRRYDFLGNFPESCHALTFLLDDAGIPTDYRHVNGFGIHTFKMINAQGKETLVRYQYHSSLGEQFINDDDVAAQQHFSEQTTDLMEAIERGEFPTWTLYVQTLDPELLFDEEFMRVNMTFDPLDPTKEWPEETFPLREVGTFVLNENPDSFFAENDMIAFSPGRMVPGIAPSNDKLLQARLMSYPDAHRYRLGTNNMMLPVNRPHNNFLDDHIDGFMHFRTDTRASAAINYHPSLTDDLDEAPPHHHETEMLSGQKVRQALDPVDDDYNQAGERYRSFTAARKDRFAQRVALTLSERGVTDLIVNTWLDIWEKVDANLARDISNYLDTFKNPNSVHDPEIMALRRAFAKTSGSSLADLLPPKDASSKPAPIRMA